MTQSLGDPVQRLLESHYEAWLGVDHLVERWAALAGVATQAAWAEVTPAAGGPIPAALGTARRLATGSGSTAGDTLACPIRYQSTELGVLTLAAPALERSKAGEVCRDLAKSLAYEIKRLELSALARTRFGCELPLVGPSSSLRWVDRFVEQAARSSLPVLLVGREGAETEAIALALHLASPRTERRFVQLRCSLLERSALDQQLSEYAFAAAGGTLVLSRLDELAVGCQAALCQFLDGAALRSVKGNGPAPAAWVATASAEIDESTASGLFYRPLLDRLDILRLAIEPLCNRKADIAHLFQHSFHHLAPARRLRLSDDVLTALRAYPWPGDVAELRRVAARLAVMVEEDVVQIRHLRQFTPQIVSTALRTPAQAAAAEGRGARGLPASPDPGPAATPYLLGARHPSVRRALSFLLANYGRKMPLSEVASYAYVSASRLAHLFRQDLGATFTQVLARVRIEQAKRLLVSQPWEPITTVAGEVGFADLRHFERIFKLIVGCTPKDFRRLYVERRPLRQTTGTLDLREIGELALLETN